MMRPHLRFFMPGIAARTVWNADDRLMAMMASHFSIGNSSTGATCWMPALLTRMSTRAEVALGLGDHVGDLVVAQHVGRIEGDARAERGDLRDRLGVVLLAAEAVDDDVGAGLGEGVGDAEPDAGGRAGDDGGLAFELHD